MVIEKYVMRDRTNDSRNIKIYNSVREFGSKSGKVASFDRMGRGEEMLRNTDVYGAMINSIVFMHILYLDNFMM
jgi:hypothetical protein